MTKNQGFRMKQSKSAVRKRAVKRTAESSTQKKYATKPLLWGKHCRGAGCDDFNEQRPSCICKCAACKPPSKRAFVVTDYYSTSFERPYTNMLRDSRSDEQVSDDVAIQEALERCGAVDGDEVTITIERTGRRPFGDRKVRLVRPHVYEREPGSADPEESERAP